jgi:hypothetical protein
LLLPFISRPASVDRMSFLIFLFGRLEPNEQE